MSEKAKAVFEAMAGIEWEKCWCGKRVDEGCKHYQRWSALIVNSITGPQIQYIRRHGRKREYNVLLFPKHILQFLLIETPLTRLMVGETWNDVQGYTIGYNTIHISDPAPGQRLVTFMVEKPHPVTKRARNGKTLKK